MTFTNNQWQESLVNLANSGGGGGGGAAATVADGADVAQGTTTDAAGTATVIGLLKSLKSDLDTLAGSISSSTQFVKGNFTEQASLTAGSLNADLVASTDVSAYKWFSLQVLTIASGGTLTFQGSNDNSTWVAINVMSIGSTSTGAYTSTTTTTGIFAQALQFHYLRIRQTAWSSGSSTGVLELYTSPVGPYPLTSSAAIQSGTWTVQPGNTANTTAWKVDNSAVTQPANVSQVAGTTTSVGSGTSDNGTQRVINAGSATSTKSNVASSGSSVTVLASNTARKGAVFYNDSTQICYLDLSGGTASSTSYSVQMPANSYFELPPSTIYNGAVTGIWVSANGNMRVTEFS